MLSTAKSANVGFLPVVQLLLFAPPTNPAHAENSFYKLGENIVGVNNMSTNIRGLVGLGLGLRLVLGLGFMLGLGLALGSV